VLASISPLGERARRQRWTVTVAWLVAGGIAGGAATGAVLGLAGLAASAIPGAGEAGARAIGWALLALGAAGVELVAAPSWGRRQVDEAWLDRYRGWVYGSGYGLQLGAGFATVVTSALVPAAAAGLVAIGDPTVGALVGGLFGGVRGLSALSVARVRRPAELVRVARRLEAMADPVRRACALVAGVIALAVIGTVAV